MNTISNKHAATVGIFILLGIAILITAVFALGKQHNTFVKKFPVKAIFDDIGGLKVGDNVWLAGVKVGVIDNIQFAGDANVLITMDVEKRVESLIHKDARVRISSDGVIGNRIVVIYGGSENAPIIAGNDYLNSDKAMDTKDMLAALDSTNKNLLVITNNIKQISGELLTGKGTFSTLLNDAALPQNIKYTVSSLRTAMDHFKKTSEESERVLNNLLEFSARFNNRGTLANDLVTDTLVFKSFSSSIIKLQETVNTISGFSTNIENAGRALNENNNTAGLLLHDEALAARLRSMINNLDSASHKLNEDLEALQHNFLFRGYFRKKAKKP